MGSRRQTAAAITVAVLLVTAGCTSLVLGDTVEFDASPATVGDETLEDTGYQLDDTEEHVIEETVEAAGVTRTVVATNWVTTYEKSLEIQGEQQDAARFAVVSTPGAEVLRQSFNPIDDMTHEELLTEFESELGDEYGDFDEFERHDERTEVVLDSEATVTTFETSAELQGEEVDLYIHVTTVSHGDDIVVAVGAHPQAFAQERTNTYTLLQELEHES